VVVVVVVLLSRCALGFLAPRYHKLDLKKLLLLRNVLQ
jgi:hypothetical protein